MYVCNVGMLLCSIFKNDIRRKHACSIMNQKFNSSIHSITIYNEYAPISTYIVYMYVHI